MIHEKPLIYLASDFDTVRVMDRFAGSIADFIAFDPSKKDKPITHLKFSCGSRANIHCGITIAAIRIPCTREDDIAFLVIVSFKNENIGKFKGVIDTQRCALLPRNP